MSRDAIGLWLFFVVIGAAILLTVLSVGVAGDAWLMVGAVAAVRIMRD